MCILKYIVMHSFDLRLVCSRRLYVVRGTRVMTRLSGTVRDGQNHLEQISLSFVSVGEWATRRPCVLLRALNARPYFPEAPYMVRSRRSTIGCFYKSDDSVAGAAYRER